MPTYFAYSRLMFVIMEIVQVARICIHQFDTVSYLFVGLDKTQIYHQGLGPSDFPRLDFCMKVIQTHLGF